MNNLKEVNSYENSIAIEVFHANRTKSIGELISKIQQKEFSIPITLDQQPDLADISGFYQKAKGNFWTASLKDQVIGTIALLDIGNDQAALRKMFVHQDYRGSAFGTAKKLLENALNWARKVGLKEIYLGTTAQFHAAHRFYEKNGFLEVIQSELPAAFPIMKVDTKFYVTKL